MARIVYGVSGDGAGHSSRAKIVAKYLIDQGHEILIASYDRGYINLRDYFDVIEISGLSIVTKNNKVDKSKTFTKNFQNLPETRKRMNYLRKAAFKEFKPDCVITDFEPQTAYLANHYNIPLVTLDNQHCLRYIEYKCPRRLKANALLAQNVIKAMVPKPDYSIITTFYEGKLTNNRSFLTAPLIRDEILDLQPTDGDYIIVYFTKGFKSLNKMLQEFPREKFILYGFQNGSEEYKKEANVEYKPFDNEQFLEDLASCKAIIGTAGFTLITEGFYLGKPYLATPMAGQFEQEYNGYMLEQCGFGKNMLKLNKNLISAFLYEIPDYKANLKNYNHIGNSEVFNKLDELLANDLAELKKYHKKRLLSKKIESFFDLLDK